MTTIVISGAGGSAAANVIDSIRLADPSIRIVGIDASPIRLHLSTADERYITPLPSCRNWLSAINRMLEATGAQVFHAQPDPEVLILGRQRGSVHAATFLPSQDALEIASDKVLFAHALAAHAVGVPESIGFESFDHLRSSVRTLLDHHASVWVRARRGAGARASLPISSVEQAHSWVKWWVEEKNADVTDFMAAERLPGREFAYQSIWQHGALIAGQARERVEYLYGHLTPHGQTSTPAVARTVRDPRVDLLAQQAIRAIDPSPSGVFCADIKEAADGTLRVTEVNAGRFFTTSNFFAHAGLNMPAMLVRAALGDTLSPSGSSPLEPDLYWIRMVDMGYRLVHGNELTRWTDFA